MFYAVDVLISVKSISRLLCTARSCSTLADSLVHEINAYETYTCAGSPLEISGPHIIGVVQVKTKTKQKRSSSSMAHASYQF